MQHWKFTLIVGMIFLSIALYIFYSDSIHDVNALETNDTINLDYSNNIEINNIEFNFFTNTKPQYVNIHYNITHKENKTGFVAFDLPYKGSLSQSQNEWQTKVFEKTNSVVIFKNYTCTSNPCLNDYGDLKFIFTESIESIKNFKHFIKIPLSGTSYNLDITTFYNTLAKIPSFHMGWNISGTSIVKVNLPYDTDEWTTQPESALKEFPNSNGNNHIILVWPITESNSLLTANYISPYERFMVVAKPTLFGVLIGIGFSMVTVAVQTKKDETNTRFLHESITKTKVDIEKTLDGISSIVENEHLEKERKEIEENRIYKISLLHDLSGVIHSIYQTIIYVKSRDSTNKESNSLLKDTINANAEEFKYWAGRISLINTNTYVPAKIRDTVNILLHQGIKPIYSYDLALQYDFLEKTVLNYLNDILDSDYIAKDSDSSVQHYLEEVKKSRDFLYTLKNKFQER